MTSTKRPSEANSPAVPVGWSDERLAELTQFIDWDTGLTTADEIRQLREVFKRAVLPAPVDAGVREALEQAKAIMKRAVEAYYVASGLVVLDDGIEGYGPLREMREFLDIGADSFRGKDRPLASQPVVSGVQKRPIAESENQTEQSPPVVSGRFNINDYVWVRLTEVGRKADRDWHTALFYNSSSEPDYRAPEQTPAGWSRWQLWELMQRFGANCGNGRKVPFETEIRFDDPDAPLTTDVTVHSDGSLCGEPLLNQPSLNDGGGR